MTNQPTPIRPLIQEPEIEAMTLDRYLDYSFPTRNDIIGNGVLPEQSTLLVLGDKGIGKTIIVANISLCIASQSPVVDEFPVTQKQRVLLIQKEITDTNFQERLTQAATWYNQLDARCIVIPKQNQILDLWLCQPQGMYKLEQLIMYWQPKVVAIDPWEKFHLLNGNDNHAIKPIINNLTRLKSKYGVSFIISHHYKKPQTDWKGKRIAHTMWDSLGAVGLVNDVDSVFGLDPIGDGKEKVYMETFIRNTSGEHPKFVLTRDRKYARFVGEVQGDPTNVSELKAQIILTKNNGQMCWKDLEYALVKDKTGPVQARRAIIALHAKRLVYVVGGGDYVNKQVISLSPGAKKWFG